MQISPIDFVQLEFQDENQLTPQDWLRKMQEYAVLQNSKIPLNHLLELSYEQKNALRSAISALYFSDNSDYRNALYNVVRHLSKIPHEDLDEETIKAIFNLFEPA